MAHLLSSECHTTDTTLCYKTRPCGTVCITCTTVGVPSLCMELHTRHTPLRTSSPEPCVVTNTTAKHQSHRTIALCGNIPHYINLVGRELQQLLGGGSAVSHVSRAVNLLTNIFHTPTTRMREAQFHVLTIQSIIREGYGELQFLNLHSDHTTPTTQRTSYHIYIILLSLLPRNVQRRVSGGLAGHSHWWKVVRPFPPLVLRY